MLASIQATLAAGMKLARNQKAALGPRGVNAAALARINTEQTTNWFGILVLIVAVVGLITPSVG